LSWTSGADDIMVIVENLRVIVSKSILALETEGIGLHSSATLAHIGGFITPSLLRTHLEIKAYS
jgi:hypothetical protein